ncbi:hypothetical protein HDU85_001272 [Gaertneriomyces sp. JEL0708]|nr:hypothetical protein HDU85_001272 [Gaertneriomyces sp. JEL0708]
MEAQQQPQNAKTAAAASRQKHLARLRNVRAKRRSLADEHHSTRQPSRGSSEAEERDEHSSREEEERLCRRKVPVAARAAEAFADERPGWPEEMEVDWWSVGGGRRPGWVAGAWWLSGGWGDEGRDVGMMGGGAGAGGGICWAL